MTSLPDTSSPDLRDLLAFYAQAGVDEPLNDEPVDRFAAVERPTLGAGRSVAAPPPPRSTEPPSPGSTARAPTVAVRSPAAAVPDGSQVALARQSAAQATTLDELRLQLAGFEGCNLKFTAKHLIFSDGDPRARIMLVGGTPGRDDDYEGLPFAGKEGQLLDRMLAAIGLDRQSVYLANAVPWRPPGNRAPTPQELAICRPFIERQIELANPRVLVALGGCAAQALLNSKQSIPRLRGHWKIWSTASGVEIPIMATLDPDYLLRNPAHKKFAWRDLLEVKARLRELQS